MGRRKLDKFRDNESSRNVIQPGKKIFDEIKGNWNPLFFKNKHPVVLELACGKGEYTVGLARLFPEWNVIGVDIKGSRIWRGSRTAESEGLTNAAFLRIQIQQLDQYFEDNEVDGIWITFPDPRPRDRDERRRLTHPRFLNMYRRILKPGGWIHLKTDNEVDGIWITFPDPRPRERDERRRLTHPRFLNMYRKILKPGGWIHLKTDNEDLFTYSLEVLASLNYVDQLEYTHDLYQSGMLAQNHGIQTTYEKRFLEENISIKYLRFQIKPDDKD